MTTKTQLGNYLVMQYDQQSNMRLSRINRNAPAGALLSYGRAINRLQNEHAHTFFNEVQSSLTRA